MPLSHRFAIDPILSLQFLQCLNSIVVVKETEEADHGVDKEDECHYCEGKSNKRHNWIGVKAISLIAIIIIIQKSSHRLFYADIKTH